MASAPWSVGSQIGELILEARLGAGGMGEVFGARHVASGAAVAVKVFAPEFDAEDGLRAAREREAHARVSAHPNVGRVYGAGEAFGRRYLVLELLEGGDLEARLREGPLPVAEACHVVEAIARAVAHAHAAGVLHRDLKPANVLFDAAGTPKLVDFGVARLAGAERLTATGALVGTPGHMAPEQARGERAAQDERTDVYGLGAILYHCLTGRPPFVGLSALDTVRRVIEEPLRPPSALRPGLSEEVDEVCARALAREPAARYPSALALAAALARLGGPSPGDPAPASPPSGERPRRRRRALLLVVGGAAGLALGVLLATSPERAARARLVELRRFEEQVLAPYALGLGAGAAPDPAALERWGRALEELEAHLDASELGGTGAWLRATRRLARGGRARATAAADLDPREGAVDALLAWRAEAHDEAFEHLRAVRAADGGALADRLALALAKAGLDRLAARVLTASRFELAADAERLDAHLRDCAPDIEAARALQRAAAAPYLEAWCRDPEPLGERAARLGAFFAVWPGVEAPPELERLLEPRVAACEAGAPGALEELVAGGELLLEHLRLVSPLASRITPIVFDLRGQVEGWTVGRVAFALRYEGTFPYSRARLLDPAAVQAHFRGRPSWAEVWLAEARPHSGDEPEARRAERAEAIERLVERRVLRDVHPGVAADLIERLCELREAELAGALELGPAELVPGAATRLERACALLDREPARLPVHQTQIGRCSALVALARGGAEAARRVWRAAAERGAARVGEGPRARYVLVETLRGWAQFEARQGAHDESARLLSEGLARLLEGPTDSGEERRVFGDSPERFAIEREARLRGELSQVHRIRGEKAQAAAVLEGAHEECVQRSALFAFELISLHAERGDRARARAVLRTALLSHPRDDPLAALARELEARWAGGSGQ